MRAAYVRQYGDPPAGAAFGADVSWWQAATNDTADWPTALACWRDRLAGWAEFVAVRVTTGAYGVDTTWGYHAQAAGQVGYTGKLGAYHYAYPSINRDPLPEALNFVRQWDRFAFDFAMLDMEDAAGFDVTDWARAWVDAVNERIDRPLMLYTAQWYTSGNMAGSSVASVPLWVAHYAKGGTVDPGYGSWNIPRLPSWSTPPPAVWQFDSLTPELGSLDLNVAFDPAAVGLDRGEPSPTLKEWFDDMKHAILPDGRVYLLFGGLRSHVPNPNALQALHNWGLVDGDPQPCQEHDLEPFTDVSQDVLNRLLAGGFQADQVRQVIGDSLAKWSPPAPATPVDPASLSNADLLDRLAVLLNEVERRFPKS